MKLCGWCEKAPATTRYTAPELAGMYVSVCAPCLAAEREAARERIRAERAAREARTKRFVVVADGGAETSVEVLGEAYQTTFATRAAAEAVLAQLREDAPDYGFGDVVYEIREVGAQGGTS